MEKKNTCGMESRGFEEGPSDRSGRRDFKRRAPDLRPELERFGGSVNVLLLDRERLHIRSIERRTACEEIEEIPPLQVALSHIRDPRIVRTELRARLQTTWEEQAEILGWGKESGGGSYSGEPRES